MRNLWKTRQEETLVLARAQQHCAEKLGVSSRGLCDVAWDLQRCMVPLMHLQGEDILETLLLRATDDDPRASPTLAEVATLLGNGPTSQEAWEITT